MLKSTIKTTTDTDFLQLDVKFKWRLNYRIKNYTTPKPSNKLLQNNYMLATDW